MSNFIQSIGENKIGGYIADGPWVEIGKIMLYSGSPAKQWSTTISLEEYLPDDGCVYLCQVCLMNRTGTSSGNLAYARLWSGTGTDSSTNIFVNLAAVQTQTNSFRWNAGTALLPIFPQDRNITYYNPATTANGNTAIYIARYRRMGTNT